MLSHSLPDPSHISRSEFEPAVTTTEPSDQLDAITSSSKPGDHYLNQLEHAEMNSVSLEEVNAMASSSETNDTSSRQLKHHSVLEVPATVA
jgi:hypothetical protein